MDDVGLCRTAPVTPGLLKTWKLIFRKKVTKKSSSGSIFKFCLLSEEEARLGQGLFHEPQVHIFVLFVVVVYRPYYIILLTDPVQPGLFYLVNIMCHMSRVSCHISHVTRHVSYVSDFKKKVFFDKIVKLVGGGCDINLPPCLFLNLFVA